MKVDVVVSLRGASGGFFSRVIIRHLHRRTCGRLLIAAFSLSLSSSSSSWFSLRSNREVKVRQLSRK